MTSVDGFWDDEAPDFIWNSDDEPSDVAFDPDGEASDSVSGLNKNLFRRSVPFSVTR